MTELERELRGSLNDVTRCLIEHLSQEAHDANVQIDKLCPCWEDEVTSALSLLDRVNGLPI